MLKLTEKDFYLCYSTEMRNYLKTKGIKYLLSGRDLRSNLPFYAYYRCDELMDVVHHWSEIRQTLPSREESK